MPIVYIGKLIGMTKRAERERSAFGKRMLMAREHAKLTQMEVRKRLGISQGTLSDLEGTNLSSGRTVEFARLYGCSADWLTTGKGDPEWDGPKSQEHVQTSMPGLDWLHPDEQKVVQAFRDVLPEQRPDLVRPLLEAGALAKKYREYYEQSTGMKDAIPDSKLGHLSAAHKPSPLPPPSPAGQKSKIKP